MEDNAEAQPVPKTAESRMICEGWCLCKSLAVQTSEVVE